MPELPEVETVRRSLAPRWIGRKTQSVTIHRVGILRNAPRRDRSRALGCPGRVRDILRHGKQLAIVFDGGRVVQVHLGMTGQLFVLEPNQKPPQPNHIHVRWCLDNGSTVCFRDPRRFGGVWVFDSIDALRESRWDNLGPDALKITGHQLRANLGQSTRAIKACLLDQGVLAGVGNIYADEALYLAGINPHTPAQDLKRADVTRLAGTIRKALAAAVRARGSTLRDFLDAELRPGSQQTRFRVYSRAGEPCPGCGMTLIGSRIAQRTTTHCPKCQPDQS
jgi:formamidopyrimidine-DNA glycosylase